MIRIPGEASEQAALRQIPPISELPMSSVTPSAHHQKQIKKPAMSMGHPSCECMNDLLAVSGDLSSDFGLTDEWLGFVINQLRYKQLLKSIESRRHST